MKRTILIGLLTLVALLAVACGPAATPTPAPTPTPPKPTPVPPTPTPKPVTLVVARNMDIRTLDPQRQYEIAPPMIMKAAYENLVTFGGGGQDFTKIEPFLADKFDISADGLTYTFKLRKGIKFHTGNEMTAADVVFSFQRLGNLKDNPAWLFSDHVKDIKAVDDLTVQITLKEPNAAFLSMLVSPNFAIVDSKAVKAKGGTDAADADKTDKATDWLDQNSAGTGPYILKGWTRNVEVVLEKNPAYWRAPAKIDRIVLRQVADATTQRQMVERGDVDIAQNLDADLIAEFKKAGKGQVIEGATMDIMYLAMTTNKDISKELANKKVRQAISYAIDYDGIVKGLMKGAAVQLPSIIPLGLLGTDPGMALKQDVAKAKALLKEAGLEKGFKVKMSFPTATFVGGLSAETLAAKLQSDLKAIGVTLELEPRETVAWRADYRAGKLAITIADWTPDFLDSHGWAVPFAVKGASAAKRVHYDNPEAAKLATDAGMITDAAKRAEMYKKVQTILIDDAAFVGLYQPKALIAIGPTVKGYVFSPVYGVDFYLVSK